MGASATVVGEAREVVAVDQSEMVLDGGLASTIVGAEPSGVSSLTARNTLNVGVGVAGVGLGAGNGGVDLRLLGGRAADEGSPLVVDVAGDRSVAGKLGLGDIPNSGVEVLGVAVVIDVREEVRWLDGELSFARSTEVVRMRHW